jgi:hypothetical protein
MPFSQPSRSDVHINTPLTNISIAYAQDTNNFVAGKVFPGVPVSKQSDAYFTYDRGEFNRDEMLERAPGTESAGGTYTIGNSTYYARTYAFHRDIPESIRANSDSPINLDREAVIYVTQKALLRREILWAANYFTAGAPGATWTFDVDGVASSATAAASFDPTDASNNDKLHWSDASSTPIEDIRQGKRYVLEATGFEPNTLTLGKAVYDYLVDHPDIVGRIDRGQTAGASRANLVTLADLFEVEKVLVMKAINNTAHKGQTATHAFIGGKHALLSYAPATPGIMTPSAGYTFNWTGLIGSGVDGMRIKRFYMDHIESERIEIDMSFDQKLIAADLGYFFGAIVV